MMKYLYKSMKIRIFAFAAIAVLLLAACDDGRIYNEVAVDTTGRSARLTADMMKHPGALISGFILPSAVGP